LRDRHFANDHLDAFNAAVDAGVVLSAFVIAAEAEVSGACPVSVVRIHSDAPSRLLKHPDHVFPTAGIAVGYPAEASQPSMRLPLSATVHRNTFLENGLDDAIEAYDRCREAAQPYAAQRYVGGWVGRNLWPVGGQGAATYAFRARVLSRLCVSASGWTDLSNSHHGEASVEQMNETDADRKQEPRRHGRSRCPRSATRTGPCPPTTDLRGTQQRRGVPFGSQTLAKGLVS
jgi:hypothetical protein